MSLKAEKKPCFHLLNQIERLACLMTSTFSYFDTLARNTANSLPVRPKASPEISTQGGHKMSGRWHSSRAPHSAVPDSFFGYRNNRVPQIHPLKIKPSIINTLGWVPDALIHLYPSEGQPLTICISWIKILRLSFLQTQLGCVNKYPSPNKLKMS